MSPRADQVFARGTQVPEGRRRYETQGATTQSAVMQFSFTCFTMLSPLQLRTAGKQAKPAGTGVGGVKGKAGEAVCWERFSNTEEKRKDKL